MDVDRPTRVSTLVVAAASRHGSTAEIADRLADELTRCLSARWVVRRVSLSDVRALDGADAVILGSAIYYGRWMRSAATILEHLRAAPPRHLWLFSTGPVDEDELENEHVISADTAAELGRADGHRVFGGRLEHAGLTFTERLVVRAVRARSGDHRNWADVNEWAHAVAAELDADREVDIASEPVPRRPGA